jgi:polysaccharide export outer membrane protein
MYHLRVTIYDLDSVRKAAVLFIISALSVGFAGCNNKTLDPGQIGRFRPTPAVNVILNSLGVAEESPVAWESGQEPQPGDIVAVKADYALRPGDLVRVSIFELFQEGVPLVNDYIVSETGNVSIPDVGVLQAAGRTERQLEDEIKRILSPNVLREPSVTVTLLDSQQRTFSILGNAVSRPSRYLIPRYDFRLADALATAGAQMQFNVSNIYVSRKGEAGAEPAGATTEKRTPELKLVEPGPQSKMDRGTPGLPPALRTPPSKREIPEPSEPAQKYELEREMLDLIAPQAQSAWPRSQKVAGAPRETAGQRDVTASVMPEGIRVLTSSNPAQPQTITPGSIVRTPVEFGGVTPPEPARPEPTTKERTEWVFKDGKWVQIIITSEGTPKQATAEAEPGGGLEWIFRDGRWVQVQKGEPGTPKPEKRVVEPPQATKPPAKAEPPAVARPLDKERLPMDAEWEQAIQTRLIRIPADKLLAGDPRYNVIIKPGDTIHVPVDIIGEFAIMGNVNKSGYIDITGRPMTLKMAIAAAGGLGPLAWPKNVEVVRRVGTAREEIVMVDLDKIASGEQPDFFIKPNDLVNVGTHPTARWRAVLRNAFRATYGFGFVYDRNFADIDYGTGLPWLRHM